MVLMPQVFCLNLVILGGYLFVFVTIASSLSTVLFPRCRYLFHSFVSIRPVLQVICLSFVCIYESIFPRQEFFVRGRWLVVKVMFDGEFFFMLDKAPISASLSVMSIVAVTTSLNLANHSFSDSVGL